MRCSSQSLIAPKYRPDIDGLRAFAVLLVVGYHAFPKAVRAGFLGVDIFFVISGYLISTIIMESLQQDRFSFPLFYSRRVSRIFPALFLVLISCLAFGWFFLLPADYLLLGKHVAGGAGFLSNFVLLGESGYFDTLSNTKILLHLWSLGIEEQFYIVWPLLLWATWKGKLNWITAIVVLGSLSLFLGVQTMQRDQVAAFYLPQTRFWELLAGALLSVVRQKSDLLKGPFLAVDRVLSRVVFSVSRENNGTTASNVLSLGGALLMAVGLAFATVKSQLPGYDTALPTVGAALLIAAGSQAWLNRTVLSHKIVTWFGLISFPLYLWHWPLFAFARILEGGEPSHLVRFLLIAASIVLASLTYLLIERPIRSAKTGAVKTFILLGLMALVGAAGFAVFQTKGVTSRYPQNVQDLVNYHYDDASKEFQEGTFFLKPEQDSSAFRISDLKLDKGKKTILLWGDSHMADLYSGYQKVYGQHFNVIQLTASASPPILNMEAELRPHCPEVNAFVFNYIKETKPEIVVLSARWAQYDWKRIDETIERLQSVGIGKIVVLGPSPEWQGTLPLQMTKHFLKNHTLPLRMTLGLDQSVSILDKQMREYLRSKNVSYVSPFELLNTAEGCLTRSEEAISSMLIYDYSHFTKSGAEYLVSLFPRLE